MKKIVLLIVLSVILNSCGTTWVIRTDRDGGIIGYKGYSSPDEARDEILALIHCPKYQFVSDELKSSTSSVVLPMQSTNYSSGTVFGQYGSVDYSGQQTQTTYVPTTVHNTWRELTYQCIEDNSNTAQVSGERIIYVDSSIADISKVATINIVKAMQSSREGFEGQLRLREEFLVAKRRLDNEQARIKLISDKHTYQQEIEKYNVLLRYEQSRINELEASLTKPMFDTFKAIVEKIGKKKGYYKVIHSDNGVGDSDLTILAIDEYNKIRLPASVKKNKK